MIFTILKLTISLTFIWILYHKIPIADLWDQMAIINWMIIPFILVLFLLNTLISSWKWQLLLRSDRICIPFRRLLVSYLIGSFFNLFLPSNIGGDSYRIYDIYQNSSRSGSSFASVLADRLSGFLALTLLSLFACLWLGNRNSNIHDLMWIPLGILVMLLGIIALLMYSKLADLLLEWLPNGLASRIGLFIRQLFDAFTRYGTRQKVCIHVLGLSLVFQISAAFCSYLMARSLHIEVSFLFFCAFIPLITLVEAIPISIYGIGVRDAGYAVFFALAGLTQIQTRSLALLYLGITAFYSLSGGILFLFVKKNRGDDTRS